jgi:hypothetical protein
VAIWREIVKEYSQEEEQSKKRKLAVLQLEQEIAQLKEQQRAIRSGEDNGFILGFKPKKLIKNNAGRKVTIESYSSEEEIDLGTEEF